LVNDLILRTEQVLNIEAFIYKDIGVAPAVDALKQSAIQMGYNPKYINALELLNSGLKNAKLFIMPGGADLSYCQKLNGAGTRYIKDWVYNGGTYVGICAGAYFGSAYCEFDKGGKKEVTGVRELAFFPGKAVGPLFGEYSYASHQTAQTVCISFNGQKYTTYYNGGCKFVDASGYKNVKILATYETGDAAVIEISHGKGKAILSGVHFEITADYLKKETPKTQDESTRIQKILNDIKDKKHLNVLSKILNKIEHK